MKTARAIYRLGLTACVIALLPTAAPARRMERVLQECDAQAEYPAYAQCIKDRYNKVGNTKKSGTVWAFYTLLDEIGDTYAASQSTSAPMTKSQSRANVYRAWQSTIEASNVGETGKICSMSGNVLACN